MRRRHLLVASTTSVLSGLSFAQARPLRLVVPFPPGGATDITARALAEPLARALGQPVVVDNKAGAGGSIGMADVARSAPDGLTLGVATLSTHGVNPAVYAKLPYDAEKDFVAVTEIVKAPGVLVVNPSLPPKSMPEFVAHLKRNPGRLMYASPGNGTIGHMWGELFKSTTNTFMVHIPYRGAAPAVTDLLAGQVQVYFDQVASSLPHIQAGRLRPLAVSWHERLKSLPDVPTYAELALFANNDPSWFGLVAPAGTPAAVVRRIRDAVAGALADTTLRERLSAQGLFPSGSLPEDFAAQIRKEVEKFRRIAQFAKIKLD